MGEHETGKAGDEERAVHPTTAGPDESVAVLRLGRGKVNALNPGVVAELDARLDELRDRRTVRGVVLTGTGAFFSFGFDVPEMYDLDREEFGAFLSGFCAVCRKLFAFPKPVVAALNGHATAGGCILALAADERIAADGRGRIGLNERLIGATVFGTCVEMLVNAVGARNAERALYSGEFYPMGEACRIGLVDRCVPEGELLETAVDRAATLGELPDAFAAIKRLLRRDRAGRMAARDRESIDPFLDLWYAPDARRLLRAVEVRA